MTKKKCVLSIDEAHLKILKEIKLCPDESYNSVIVRLLKMHPDYPKFKDRLR
jgi:hypothetical protein